MKKYLWLILAAFLAIPSLAHAGVQVSEDGNQEGEAVKINLSTDLDGTFTGGDTYTISLESVINPTDVNATGELKFQTDLFASGRYTASSTIPSSSNGINPSTLPYSLLLKSIGNVAGETATLPNGTKNGQTLYILINGCGPSGTWIVTPTIGAGWTNLTFDTRGDNATLVWDSTQGWIISSTSGTTVLPKKN